MMYCRCVRPHGRPIVSQSAMLRPSASRVVRPLRGRTWQESRFLGAGSAEFQPAPLDCAKNMHCLLYLAFARFVVRPFLTLCVGACVSPRTCPRTNIRPLRHKTCWSRGSSFMRKLAQVLCAKCRIYRKIDYFCGVIRCITY